MNTQIQKKTSADFTFPNQCLIRSLDITTEMTKAALFWVLHINADLSRIIVWKVFQLYV